MTWSYKHVLAVALTTAGCSGPNPKFIDTEAVSSTRADMSATQTTTATATVTTTASPTSTDSSSGSDGSTSTSTSTTTTTGVSSVGPSSSTSTSGVSTSGTTGLSSTSGIGSSTGEPVCDCQDDEICGDDFECYGAQFFLEFGSIMLEYNPGVQNALTNTTNFLPNMVNYAEPTKEYGGTPQDEDALVDAVQALFGDLDVLITKTRPQMSPFSMIVLGDNLMPPFLELSNADCGNANDWNVSIVDVEFGDMFTTEVEAKIIAHAIGHMSGLDHTLGDLNIMNKFANDEPTGFNNSCQSLDMGPPPPACEHPCGPNTQNSYAELLELYGSN